MCDWCVVFRDSISIVSMVVLVGMIVVVVARGGDGGGRFVCGRLNGLLGDVAGVTRGTVHGEGLRGVYGPRRPALLNPNRLLLVVLMELLQHLLLLLGAHPLPAIDVGSVATGSLLVFLLGLIFTVEVLCSMDAVFHHVVANDVATVGVFTHTGCGLSIG